MHNVLAYFPYDGDELVPHQIALTKNWLLLL